MAFVAKLFGDSPQAETPPPPPPPVSAADAFSELSSRKRSNAVAPSGARTRLKSLSPFAATLDDISSSSAAPPPPGQQQQDVASSSPPRWMVTLPVFGAERRFRPSEAWNAISPGMAPLREVFPADAGALATPGIVTPADVTALPSRSGTADAFSASLGTSTEDNWLRGSFGTASSAEPSVSAAAARRRAQGVPEARDDNPFIVKSARPPPRAPFAMTPSATTLAGAAAAAASSRQPSPSAVSSAPDMRSSSSQPGSALAAVTASTTTTSASQVAEGGDDEGDGSDPWLRFRLLSLGSVNNPQSSRLFTGLAGDQLARERAAVAAEAVKRSGAGYVSTTRLRSATNMVPPTPFSQTVPTVDGPVPDGLRRHLQPALDLEGADTSDDDADADDADDGNRFDAFLREELARARNEKPRSDRHGDFYHLALQPHAAPFRILHHPPSAARDPLQVELEHLAVSRPEFAPALRRLAPWQLHLIDWPSLCRGGTHSDVSVTGKRFAHGVAWATSPFSEAPVESGALGFVGNLRKRDEEAAFFAAMHPANDGRVAGDQMRAWVEQCPIRFNLRDDD
jgi:hypothetical protein